MATRPVPGAAHRGAFARLGLDAAEERQLLFELLIRALLRLHDEGVAPVEVDASGAGRAVRIGEPDRVFESIAIARGIAGAGPGRSTPSTSHSSMANDWKLARSAALDCGPPRDEGLDRVLALRLSLREAHPGCRFRHPTRVLRENRVGRKRLNARWGQGALCWSIPASFRRCRCRRSLGCWCRAPTSGAARQLSNSVLLPL